MGHPATLKKISSQLNLSISTVSRALKNHPDISENTKRKVKDLAALMEYEPNSYAVNLRLNKSYVFGLIVPAISNMFYDSFIAAVEEGARKKGYLLMILQSGDDPLVEAENLKLCKHNRVDGIFISLGPQSGAIDLINKYQQSGIPVVFFDKVPVAGSFDRICMADEEAATLAAYTILKYKKKRVLGLFGNPDLSITIKRKEAFLHVLDKEKKISTQILCCRNSEEARKETDRALLQSKAQRPDHIFCMSDELLIGAMKAIHQSGLIIPTDISVLAISHGFLPGIFNPEITYIETNGQALGKLAIARMLEKIEGNSPPRSIILPSRLVKGHSL
ncbi:MAG TPA: LacI family DNA-binding transcriptional regulator [Chitinophagaceae bacterium]|nr:LacI family DNA-binding transcriptional regulator [Chitinophagaceae bacterium]